MAVFRDKFWLWGQDAGTHHLPDNPFKPPGKNRMISWEGSFALIYRTCAAWYTRVGPRYRMDHGVMDLGPFDRVVWSIVDYGGMGRQEDERADVCEVATKAKLHGNIIGVITGFFCSGRAKGYNWQGYTEEKS